MVFIFVFFPIFVFVVINSVQRVLIFKSRIIFILMIYWDAEYIQEYAERNNLLFLILSWNSFCFEIYAYL